MLNRDREILLAHSIDKDRCYLYSHPEYQLTKKEAKTFNELCQRRLAGEPIAYIIGHKEFWSLSFEVTKDTLIPRPETELLVELALKSFPANENIKVADLGTGCGAIALSIARERPLWQVVAVDNSKAALKIATKNAASLKINNISFKQSDWCANFSNNSFDLIVSNPPYIAPNDSHLKGEIRFEPMSALVAGDDGLRAIKTIISEARDKLTAKGILMLEHGYNQGKEVRELMQRDYCAITTHLDLAQQERVTLGHINCQYKQ